MIEVRCTKCGKVLRDPESMARGMGPKCSGLSRHARAVNVKGCRRSALPYSLSSSCSVQAALPIFETAPKKQSKEEQVSSIRVERRRLFEERKPFQCGLLLPERKPVIYTPTANGDWKNNSNESVIPHNQLQSYLKRYRLI